ncbi:hypothetical protein BJ742DRAFT_852796 [Cladochytrium replicatum]|nr:hypothetical protein BJ742DRAFT_852796 [Cladochytrium replicatum]
MASAVGSAPTYWEDVLALLSALKENPFDIRTYFADPLLLTLLLNVILILSCYILQRTTGNYSWVDRVWSISPPLFALIIMFYPIHTAEGLAVSVLSVWNQHPRLLFVGTLIVLWGIRLTYNFARKGGYDPKEEDYRWAWCRKVIPNPILWELFSSVFISFYQLTLIWLISALPMYIVWRFAQDTISTPSVVGWTSIDTLATLFFVIFFLMEIIADEQQWAFQNRKWAFIRASQEREALLASQNASTSGSAGKNRSTVAEIVAKLPAPYSYGFSTIGVFRYSRHLNFFGEFMMWWAVYLYSVATSEQLFFLDKPDAPERATFGTWWMVFGQFYLVNWSIFGTVLLTLLFQGSTALTEHLTLQKYPLYKLYQMTTSSLVPWFPGSSVEEIIDLAVDFNAARQPADLLK